MIKPLHSVKSGAVFRALQLGDLLSGFGKQDYKKVGFIPNNAGAGKTGDILFTTNGASAGDTYSIELHLIKKYG